MNDLQIGDRCTVSIDEKKYQGIVIILNSSAAQVYIPVEKNSGQFMLSVIERHPRPMESIEVWDSDTWVIREAIRLDEDGGVWAASTVDGAMYFTDWRFLSAKEDKEEIIRKIENDDPDILGELAEIILAAREKVSK